MRRMSKQNHNSFKQWSASCIICKGSQWEWYFNLKYSLKGLFCLVFTCYTLPTFAFFASHWCVYVWFKARPFFWSNKGQIMLMCLWCNADVRTEWKDFHLGQFCRKEKVEGKIKMFLKKWFVKFLIMIVVIVNSSAYSYCKHILQ